MMLERYALECAENATKKGQGDFWTALAARTLSANTKLTFRQARAYIRDHQDYDTLELYEKICEDFVYTPEQQLEKINQAIREHKRDIQKLMDRATEIQQKLAAP